jgi:hypothetical protein
MGNRMHTLKRSSQQGYWTVAIVRSSLAALSLLGLSLPMTYFAALAQRFDLSGGGAFYSTDTTAASALADDAARVVGAIGDGMFSIIRKASTAACRS